MKTFREVEAVLDAKDKLAADRPRFVGVQMPRDARPHSRKGQQVEYDHKPEAYIDDRGTLQVNSIGLSPADIPAFIDWLRTTYELQ